MDTNNKNNNTNLNLLDMETLIANLKSEDRKYLRIGRGLMVLYFVLIALYAFIYIFDPYGDLSSVNRIGGICFIIAFIGFIIYFQRYTKVLRAVNYSLPTAEMLRKAINRYRVYKPEYLIMIIPLLFMDAGLVLTFLDHAWGITQTILIVQGFFIPIIAISVYIGIVIWKKNHKPLRDKAKELLRDIEY